MLFAKMCGVIYVAMFVEIGMGLRRNKRAPKSVDDCGCAWSTEPSACKASSNDNSCCWQSCCKHDVSCLFDHFGDVQNTCSDGSIPTLNASTGALVCSNQGWATLTPKPKPVCECAWSKDPSACKASSNDDSCCWQSCCKHDVSCRFDHDGVLQNKCSDGSLPTLNASTGSLVCLHKGWAKV
eukprot:TRINITY_DN10332_c0_g1_i2.p1 TRINITY_DN10332_c0_g1~~TRINITY_DN10332_c0_g1_i2.p1  ORF type:complete len:182 (-),score=20.97 TRINITY_DN10332_c0_g1_i2:141-686(-)